MNKTPKPPYSGVLTVVLAYALFASTWILLSDRAIAVLFRDPDTLVRASMVKGWLFVAVTSLLLYGLVRRLTRALREAHERELAAEKSSRQPPPMLVAIADASDDPIFAKDESGRYVLFNNAAARFVGKSVESVLGRDDRALFPPAQAEMLMHKDRRLRTSGAAETDEEILQSAQGERIVLANKGVLRDAQGRIFGTYGICRDITERKRVEASLRHLADDLSATLQAIPDLMFEVDEEGRYLKAKSLKESLLAAPSDQLIGRTIDEVLPEEAAAVSRQALAAASLHGSDFGRTMTLPMAEGVRHFELSVARKSTPEGQRPRFIVLSRDITERVAVEAELRQRNQELERFSDAATERELRMIALKREVNELARAAGRPAPYDVSYADVVNSSAVP